MFDFTELPEFALELLKLPTVWAAFGDQVLDCASASDALDLLLDAGYGQVMEY